MKKLILLFGLLFPVLGFAEGISAPYKDLDKSFFENPNPLSPEWEDVPADTVLLLPQNITTPSVFKTSVPNLKIKAVHNKKWIAIRLEWEDKTKNYQVLTDRAGDACAVQFPVKSLGETSPFMGSKGSPVSILHWKAVWQNDIEKHYQTVKDLFPNTWVDTYRFGIEAAIDLKNPVSQPERKTPAEELMAEGFGTLTTQATQGVQGWGTWKEGKWVVVFARPLKSKDKHDPTFKIGEETAMAFAIWEGGAKDIGSRKNYAMWTPLKLEAKK